MNIWKRIGQLSIGQLIKLSVLFLKHPLLIIPTLRATKRTFQICDKLYGTSHHKRNRANAFRHAFWNALLCKYSMKMTKNKQKSVFWAQKVTDLYEKVTQNDKLDEAMDVHNNAIGRICFLNTLEENEAEIVEKLNKMAKNAQKIAKIEEIKENYSVLVYIEE
ncbi:DUF6973 domain-containing protein [Jejudonia soesokkakensis]|uniref:DUF6973 domain-containing protein n=1 Tax=Jejudonia soesokkakensis TaxID=1323432 RepID=A0ABW2MQY3_9FLAO